MSNLPPRRGEQRPPTGDAAPPRSNTPARANRSTPPRRPIKEVEYSEDQYEEEQPSRRPSRTATGQSPRSRSSASASSGSAYRQGSRPHSRPAQPRYVAPRRDLFPIIMGAAVGMLVVGVLIAVYLLMTRDNGVTTTANSNTNTDANANPTAAPVSANANDASQPTAAATMAQSTNPSGIQTMQAIRPANGLGTPMPDEGNEHVDEGQPITYKNYPPSSGTHYGATVEYGFHDEEVPEGKFVHSLEHGAIVIYYKPDISADIKQKLKDAYTTLPQSKYGKVKLAIVPYANMQTPLAIAAWDRLLPIATFNYEEIQTFYNEWVDKGPEDVP